MSFNIEDFKARGLLNSGARPSLFQVILTDWPGSTPEATNRFSFLAKASQIPPSIIGQIDVPYFGRSIKVMGDRTYPNWNVTVYNDVDFLVRETMETWHQGINQHIENVTSGDVTPKQTSYKRDAIVQQLGKDGEVLKEYTIKGMFPIQIDAIALDWEAANQIELFDVDFSIDYWLPNAETGASEASSFPEGSRNIAIE